MRNRIATGATDLQKRELYERLAVRFKRLADEIEKATKDRPEKTAN
jgi:hypothetical protein